MSKRSAVLLAIAVAVAVAAHSVFASTPSELAFQRGVVAYGESRLDEARAQFEAVLAEEPRHTAAFRYLALVARARGDIPEALARYRDALAVEPGRIDLQADLAMLLLESGNDADAQRVAEQVLAVEPDQPRAQLVSGIAAYHRSDHATALRELRRASQLDGSIKPYADYYLALVEMGLGRPAEVASALSSLEQQDHPLAETARKMRQQLRPADKGRGRLEFSAGGEWDSNAALLASAPGRHRADLLGVLHVQAAYDALRRDRSVLRFGYEGHLSRHDDWKDVDVSDHVGSIAFSTNLNPVQLSLLYEGRYAQLGMGRSFLRSHRITPSLSVAEGELGVTQVYGQVDWRAYLRPTLDPAPPHPFDDRLNRDGNRVSLGMNQYFFLPRDGAYLRFGFRDDRLDTRGEEFRYRGYELSVGAGMRFFRGWQLTALYRREVRVHPHRSLFTPRTHRRDVGDRLSLELSLPVTARLDASFELNWTEVGSKIDVFDYRRTILGSYLTYSF